MLKLPNVKKKVTCARYEYITNILEWLIGKKQDFTSSRWFSFEPSNINISIEAKLNDLLIETEKKACSPFPS